VCGDGTETSVNFSRFWGCIAFVLTVATIVFVFFASYRVLFRVPRRDDPALAAFAKSKAAEVAQLSARRFGIPGAPIAPLPATTTNPFGTGSVAPGVGGVVMSASFVISDDDENENTRLVPQTVPMASVVVR
jgi:hypothetical protein